MTDPRPEPRPWNPDGFAIALIAVGALVLALCGSCTGVFAGGALWSLITHPGSQEGGLAVVILIAAALVGGIPTAGGFVLLMVGLGRARRERKPPQTTVD